MGKRLQCCNNQVYHKKHFTLTLFYKVEMSTWIPMIFEYPIDFDEVWNRVPWENSQISPHTMALKEEGTTMTTAVWPTLTQGIPRSSSIQLSLHYLTGLLWRDRMCVSPLVQGVFSVKKKYKTSTCQFLRYEQKCMLSHYLDGCRFQWSSQSVPFSLTFSFT